MSDKEKTINDSINIGELEVQALASLSANVFERITFELSTNFTSSQQLHGYKTEVIYPTSILDGEFSVKRQPPRSFKADYADITIFPGETIKIELNNIIISNEAPSDIFTKSIVVKILSSNGIAKKEFPLNEIRFDTTLKNGVFTLSQDLFHGTPR